jgi:hypothetical protein
MGFAKQLEDAREGQIDTTPPVPPPDENRYVTRPRLRLVTSETTEKDKEEGQANRVGIDALYHDRQAISPELDIALRLMSSGLGYLDEAVEAAASGEVIASDNAVMKLRAILPELFCCRSVGDGFGEAINSIQNALDNLKGIPPTRAQIEAIARLLKKVYEVPFISFDDVLDDVERLEEAELIIDPAEFEHLSNLLDV